ncbi:hypothetical protein [Mucilaginibacter dorajii]|uniref:Adhesin domain-containing protein n=1 Tax=Mucilaginibacter dorajii TaxID=692994 RepID=A0ABP7QYG9_9SPHI|nr:hypothetical protein [Mucilaginibacter dorajii]MCS3732320.1 hypothetical protein [Mucilaginibacter dorajii]
MKKIITLFALLSFNICIAHGQDQPKKLKINIDKQKNLVVFTGDVSVDFEEYAGDDLLVEPVKDISIKDGHAEGLTPIKLNNQPGDSLNYKLSYGNNNDLRIRITGNCKHLHIKVPNNLFLLTIEATSFLPNSELSVQNIKSQFIIHALMKVIRVSHVSGPFSIHSDSGKIILNDILWGANVSWNLHPTPPQLDYPYMISSNKSDVDISFPKNQELNIVSKAANGKVYSDLDPKNTKQTEGKPEVYLSSDFGNIYLRQQR